MSVVIDQEIMDQMVKMLLPEDYEFRQALKPNGLNLVAWK